MRKYFLIYAVVFILLAGCEGKKPLKSLRFDGYSEELSAYYNVLIENDDLKLIEIENNANITDVGESVILYSHNEIYCENNKLFRNYEGQFDVNFCPTYIQLLTYKENYLDYIYLIDSEDVYSFSELSKHFEYYEIDFLISNLEEVEVSYVLKE